MTTAGPDDADSAAAADGVGTLGTLDPVALHPAAVAIWRITAVGWVLVLAVVGVGVAALTGPAVAAAIAGVAAVVCLVLAWVLPPRRYRRWRYAIGADALEIHRGVWTRTTSAVPFHRIQQIDVSQGPLQRRHGVATLQLRTAAAASDGTVPHLDAADAATLRAGLLRVAAQTAGDDGH